MKKKKSLLKKHKTLFIVVLVSFLVAGFLWLNVRDKTPMQSIALQTTQTWAAKTFYPTLYSTKNITLNAIVTNPQYRNVTIVPKDSLLSNVISSVIKNVSAPQTEGLESSTWLWTPLLTIIPSYRTGIISDARKNGIKTIYLSIDSYLDIFVMTNGSEKDARKKEFGDALEKFISEANKNNIAVVAEAGWQNWAEAGNIYKAAAVIDFALQYNKSHDKKLRGFQYDVEPYMLSSYQKNKKSVLYNFINLIDQSVSKLNGSDLQLSVVIPDFYDGASGETPRFSYKGKAGFTFDHLLSVLERREGSEIIVMSYRNFSRGDDGSIDISKGEISKADTSHSKVIIAQETGDVLPSHVTFFNTSREYYNKQIAFIINAFRSNKSFGGVAVHYVNAFLELK